MDARIKKLWIEDLRANPEAQGRGALQPELGKFCCLGRLCNLFAAENSAGSWSGKYFNVRQDIGFESEEKTLPRSVRDWAGLGTNNGVYYVEEQKCALTHDNDYHLYTFPQIADTIEANF